MGAIIIGIVLIILQLMGDLGNLYSGGLNYFENVSSFAVFIYDLIAFLAYSFFGILGVILLIVGIKEKKGVNDKESPTTNDNIDAEEPITETVTTLVTINKTPSNCFCRKCGKPIDQTTKKCTGCGKQYFKGLKYYLSMGFTKKRIIPVALSISVLLCAIFYLSFLTLAFTEKTNRTTYICYTTKTGTHFHSATCKYLNTSYETTVYEASKKYKFCIYCYDKIYIDKNKTIITVTERDYLTPALISIPLSTAIFIALIIDKKDKKE